MSEEKVINTPSYVDAEAISEREVASRMKRALIAQKIVKYIPLAACAILGLLYVICALAEGYDLAIGFKVIISKLFKF